MLPRLDTLASAGLKYKACQGLAPTAPALHHGTPGPAALRHAGPGVAGTAPLPATLPAALPAAGARPRPVAARNPRVAPRASSGAGAAADGAARGSSGQLRVPRPPPPGAAAPPQVAVVSYADNPTLARQAVEAMASAFVDDPSTTYFCRPGKAVEFYRSILNCVLDWYPTARQLVCTVPSPDAAAIAYVYPRASGLDGWRRLARGGLAPLLWVRLGRVVQGMDASDYFEGQREDFFKAHGPYLYISVMGTRPDQQGRGLGSALLGFLCDRADGAGLPAYIEATSARNMALYRRFGFRLLQEWRANPDMPYTYVMWRPAAAVPEDDDASQDAAAAAAAAAAPSGLGRIAGAVWQSSQQAQAQAQAGSGAAAAAAAAAAAVADRDAAAALFGPRADMMLAGAALAAAAAGAGRDTPAQRRVARSAEELWAAAALRRRSRFARVRQEQQAARQQRTREREQQRELAWEVQEYRQYEYVDAGTWGYWPLWTSEDWAAEAEAAPPPKQARPYDAGGGDNGSTPVDLGPDGGCSQPHVSRRGIDSGDEDRGGGDDDSGGADDEPARAAVPSSSVGRAAANVTAMGQQQLLPPDGAAEQGGLWLEDAGAHGGGSSGGEADGSSSAGGVASGSWWPGGGGSVWPGGGSGGGAGDHASTTDAHGAAEASSSSTGGGGVGSWFSGWGGHGAGHADNGDGSSTGGGGGSWSWPDFGGSTGDGGDGGGGGGDSGGGGGDGGGDGGDGGD
ncbi:hypothetical protein HXX76_001023 [Chlamydomonas incerta]|uniref:N-acetyltransferase domain-containing protein n=1 Tax=Chlamydomonas incerta TaxID=51695 RepID=A0A835WBC5_CHLIN|nr:hypothetical protein HXX76_001023 [Chlamydomonas incerta]|eukprot:KAG2444266.1 hypothetical protein HXX76_001023 [Chlamydomonas incerta]